jgi:glutamyl-tRNA reductase
VVLGAGEAAESVLRALHLHGATRVALVNRSVERARVLAAAWGAGPHSWTELPELMAGADLLVVATSASRPVVRTAQLEAALAARPERRHVVMDLGVPRNVEPAARELAGIRLFDLDDLQRLCCPAAAAPGLALREAQRVLEDEITRLQQSLRGRAVAPHLAELHRIGAQMAEQESAWALAQLADLSEREQEIVREMAERLVRRVLYPVSRSMRAE